MKILGVRKLESQGRAICEAVSVILCLAILVENQLVTDIDIDTDRQTQPWGFKSIFYSLQDFKVNVHPHAKFSWHDGHQSTSC